VRGSDKKFQDIRLEMGDSGRFVGITSWCMDSWMDLVTLDTKVYFIYHDFHNGYVNKKDCDSPYVQEFSVF
jgi:hypothetical protein